MTMRRGCIVRGEFVGQRWEITRQESGARYQLDIGGEFYANADNQRQLLDEVTALDGLPRK